MDGRQLQRAAVQAHLLGAKDLLYNMQVGSKSGAIANQLVSDLVCGSCVGPNS